MLKQIAVYLSVCMSICLSEVSVKVIEEVSVKVIDSQAMFGTLIQEPRGALKIPFGVFWKNTYSRGRYLGSLLYSLVFVTDSIPGRINGINFSGARQLWSDYGNWGPTGNDYFKNKESENSVYYTQDIYLTDLSSSETKENDPIYDGNNTAKMILKFQLEKSRAKRGPITLKEILISRELDPDKVSETMGAILKQICGLHDDYKNNRELPYDLITNEDIVSLQTILNSMQTTIEKSIKTDDSDTDKKLKQAVVNEINRKSKPDALKACHKELYTEKP